MSIEDNHIEDELYSAQHQQELEQRRRAEDDLMGGRPEYQPIQVGDKLAFYFSGEHRVYRGSYLGNIGNTLFVRTVDGVMGMNKFLFCKKES